VLDVTGSPERTGKPRGADLLDGTVSLPLLEAMIRDSALARLDLRSVRTADQAAALCDRIEATGAVELAREHALSVVADAKAQLPANISPPQRVTLELIADGVVERYA
jgi:geranylgeranyl pyrophosphate synthase